MKGAPQRTEDKRIHLIVICAEFWQTPCMTPEIIIHMKRFRFRFLFKKNIKKSHFLLSFFFPLIRTEFYPKAVRSLWTSNSSRTGILCGNGAPPQRLLYQCRVRCWYWKWRSDVSRACHETLGQGGQIRAQFLSLEPFQLSPHTDWYRTRKQVWQWKW